MMSGAEVSDHLGPWTGASIALVSALAGIALSAFFESRRAAARRTHELQTEDSKRKHEATVRFHDERLSAYIEYLRTLSVLFAVARVWLDDGQTEPFSDCAGRQDALKPYTVAMTRVSFLAKPEVASKINLVHTCVERIVNQPAERITEKTLDETIVVTAAFEKAAKKELGIS